MTNLSAIAAAIPVATTAPVARPRPVAVGPWTPPALAGAPDDCQLLVALSADLTYQRDQWLRFDAALRSHRAARTLRADPHARLVRFVRDHLPLPARAFAEPPDADVVMQAGPGMAHWIPHAHRCALQLRWFCFDALASEHLIVQYELPAILALYRRHRGEADPLSFALRALTRATAEWAAEDSWLVAA